MRKPHSLLCQFLILSLLLFGSNLAADELTFVISGVEEPLLSNVRSHVEPFRIIGNARLSRRRMEEIQQSSERRTRRALRPFGFYHPEIDSTYSKVADRSWELVLTIDPGPPVLISNTVLEIHGPGAQLAELQRWQSDWPLTTGKKLNQAQWEEQKQGALDIANDDGYLLASFRRHSMELDLDNNEAALTLILDTGEQAVMGEITYDQSVVKPHMLENLPRFNPGDPYNAWMMERFRIDIWKTGYFRAIEIVEDRMLQESPPRVNLAVSLEPRNRDTYQGTIGVGSDTGPRVQLAWSRHVLSQNGDNLSVGTGWSQHNDEFFIRSTYRIPRDVKSRQYWTAEALLKRENEDLKVSPDDTDENLITIANSDISDYSLRMGRLKVHDWKRGYLQLFETMYVQYLREFIDYRPNPTDPPELRTILSRDIDGNSIERDSRTYSLGIDYDMPVSRGTGFRTSGQHHKGWAFISNEAWGSDDNFTQAYLSSRFHLLAGRKWKFLLRGEVGYTSAKVNDFAAEIDGQTINLSVTKLPNLYRFKAGGSTSVRGYGFERLSTNGIGSNNIITASAEVEFNLRPNWSAAAFFDIGNAFNHWDSVELKKGVGVGVRWYTIAGAIRVDVAKALDLQDQPWRIHFTIGTSLL